MQSGKRKRKARVSKEANVRKTILKRAPSRS